MIVGLYVPVVIFVGIANVEDFGSIPVLGAIVQQVPKAEGLVRGFIPSLGLAIVNLICLGLVNVLIIIIIIFIIIIFDLLKFFSL